MKGEIESGNLLKIIDCLLDLQETPNERFCFVGLEREKSS